MAGKFLRLVYRMFLGGLQVPALGLQLRHLGHLTTYRNTAYFSPIGSWLAGRRLPEASARHWTDHSDGPGRATPSVGLCMLEQRVFVLLN